MTIQNCVRELSKSMSLSRQGLSAVLFTTQRTVCQMENGGDIPTDLLIRMAGFFNVTRDYILGISEYKRDLGGQIRMNCEMDKYYDIVLRYQRLSEVNHRTLKVILERLEQAKDEEMNIQMENSEIHKKGDKNNVADSSV